MRISELKNRLDLPLHAATVLKDATGKRLTGSKNTLGYLFEFLDAYDRREMACWRTKHPAYLVVLSEHQFNYSWWFCSFHSSIHGATPHPRRHP